MATIKKLKLIMKECSVLRVDRSKLVGWCRGYLERPVKMLVNYWLVSVSSYNDPARKAQVDLRRLYSHTESMYDTLVYSYFYGSQRICYEI